MRMGLDSADKGQLLMEGFNIRGVKLVSSSFRMLGTVN
jgi:hypothetical protein